MKIIVDGKEMEIKEPDNMFKQIDGKWYAKVLNEKGTFATTLLNLLENNNIDNEIRELAKKIALENIELEQENKQLKSILTDLEEWVKNEYNRYLNDKENLVFSNVEVIDFGRVLDKIQELKEKYK